jgi:hypothetical protein
MGYNCSQCGEMLEGECCTTKSNGNVVGSFCDDECRDEYHYEKDIQFRKTERGTFVI